MSTPPYDLKLCLRSWATAWHQFFWEPIDPRSAAWIRIGFAAMVLINLACWYPDLTRWFGADGLVPLETTHLLRPAERWSLFEWLNPDNRWLMVIYWIFTAQTICLLLGIASRVNLLCVLIWLSAFQNRNPLILDSEDTLLRLIGWYLLLMPLNHVWSIDAWMRSRRGISAEPLAPPLGLRLLQIQMCVIFLTAAYYKLPGEAWQNGTTLYYVSRLDDYFGRFPVPAWFAETPWFVRGLTWSVLVIEIVAPLTIWFKQTRWLTLAALLAFHFGNEYTMNLYLFHWAMLLGWSSFLIPADWSWLPAIWKREQEVAAPS